MADPALLAGAAAAPRRRARPRPGHRAHRIPELAPLPQAGRRGRARLPAAGRRGRGVPASARAEAVEFLDPQIDAAESLGFPLLRLPGGIPTAVLEQLAPVAE